MLLNSAYDLIAGTDQHWLDALKALAYSVSVGTSSVSPSPDQTGLKGLELFRFELGEPTFYSDPEQDSLTYGWNYIAEYTVSIAEYAAEYVVFNADDVAVIRGTFTPIFVRPGDVMKVTLQLRLSVPREATYVLPQGSIDNDYPLSTENWPTNRWETAHIGFLSYFGYYGSSIVTYNGINPSPITTQFKVVLQNGVRLKPTHSTESITVSGAWDPYTPGTRKRTLRITFPDGMPDGAYTAICIATPDWTTIPVSSGDSASLMICSGVCLSSAHNWYWMLSGRTLVLEFSFS